MKVLVIQNREEGVEEISVYLRLAWSNIDITSTTEGGKGIELVEAESPDIVILDLELADMDGFKVVKEIRAFSDVPIIIITARQAEVDRAKSVEMGADEYITIPFSGINLMTTVKGILRRSTMPQFSEDHSSTFTSGNLTINFATHDVFVSGELVKLSPTEYNLLCNLVRNAGKVLSHRFLLEKTWGSDYTDDIPSLKKYIYRLRSKLKDEQNPQPMLVTQRGVGYKFIRP
ncbi:Sensory transduction protein regX3 [subsurface metagenome]